MTVAEEDPKNAVSGMIDVAFLLLIFFLVATTIQPREKDLEMGLPSDGVPAEPVDSILLEIRADGSVWWGEGAGALEVVAPGDSGGTEVLESMLADAVSGFGRDRFAVSLQVSDQADQQRFIDVINAMAGKGIRNVALSD